MRRTSVSLPTKQAARDPHEKPGRYGASATAPRGARLLDGAAAMLSAQRSRWAKSAAVVVAVVLLFCFLSPRGLYDQGGSGGQAPADASYGSARCARSSSASKLVVQYVLMVDAGSTGSRIHVYKFNNCGPSPELESEVFEQTKKIDGQSSGLSRYADDPDAAARSLDPLLDVALREVPAALRACTPVAVKATAGLRLLGPEKSERILDAVRARLELQYPFPVQSRADDGVAIMDGSDEGVYAWITVNFLLGKIGGPDRAPTAAVFDLGGGSTQIVFEPTFAGLGSGGMPDRLADGDHKYQLDFGGRAFALYQHSHLGYGLMSARDAIFRQVVEDVQREALASGDRSWADRPIVNPCFPSGTSKSVKVAPGKDAEARIFNMTGPGGPALPAQCRALAERLLNKDAECRLTPCSFNGVHQPSISKTFAREDIYFLSYFYDRTNPLGMPESFTLRELHDLTASVCGGSQAWDVFSSVPGALAELADRPEHCMDLNFMLALTHSGYDMPLDREVRISKQIKGNELGWALGASLPLLSKSSGWECKITEVH